MQACFELGRMAGCFLVSSQIPLSSCPPSHPLCLEDSALEAKPPTKGDGGLLRSGVTASSHATQSRSLIIDGGAGVGGGVGVRFMGDPGYERCCIHRHSTSCKLDDERQHLSSDEPTRQHQMGSANRQRQLHPTRHTITQTASRRWPFESSSPSPRSSPPPSSACTATWPCCGAPCQRGTTPDPCSPRR
jgi:hypothetical protein